MEIMCKTIFTGLKKRVFFKDRKLGIYCFLLMGEHIIKYIVCLKFKKNGESILNIPE